MEEGDVHERDTESVEYSWGRHGEDPEENYVWCASDHQQSCNGADGEYKYPMSDIKVPAPNSTEWSEEIFFLYQPPAAYGKLDIGWSSPYCRDDGERDIALDMTDIRHRVV